MGCYRPLRPRSTDSEHSYVSNYWRDGFAVIRGFFSKDEIADTAAAADQLHAEGVAHGRSFRHGNLFYNVVDAPDGDPLVRMVQWPSYHQQALDRVRLDRRFADILDPLLGPDLKQIINQVHWKAPGSLGDFAWHQDSRSRRPDWAYRNLADSYVQTGLAIDPHGPDCGGMRFIPGSHLRGDLGMDCSKKALGTPLQNKALDDVGLSLGDAIDLALEPGDLALWSPNWFTVRATIARPTRGASTSTVMCAPPIATGANGHFAQAGRCRSARFRRSSITKSFASAPNRITFRP